MMITNTIRLKPFTLDKVDYVAHVPMNDIFAMTISPFGNSTRYPATYRVWAIITKSLIRDIQADSRVVGLGDSAWLRMAKQNVLFKAITAVVSTQYPSTDNLAA